MLVVDALTVRFGPIAALRDVSIAVAPGERVAVVGPNGAGKSTLLRTVSGLVRPASGTVRFEGDLLQGRRPFRIARRGIVHVLEGRGVLEPLTVKENLTLGALRSSRAEAERAIAGAFALFPSLQRRMDVPAGLLSGGEQQMLAIARGMLARPKVLLVDEPSMGLAPIVVDEVSRGLREIAAGGTGVLIAEQNLTVARAVASRAYVLSTGEVRMECRAEELTADLLNTFRA